MDEEDQKEIPEWFRATRESASGELQEQEIVTQERARPVVLQLIERMDEINQLMYAHGPDHHYDDVNFVEDLIVSPAVTSFGFVATRTDKLGQPGMVVYLMNKPPDFDSAYGKNFTHPDNFPAEPLYELSIMRPLQDMRMRNYGSLRAKDTEVYGSYFVDSDGRIARVVEAEPDDNRPIVVNDDMFYCRQALAALYPEHFEIIDQTLEILKERLTQIEQTSEQEQGRFT